MTSIFVGFLGSSIRLQPTPLTGYTQFTSQHVVLLGGLDNYIWYLDPQIFEKSAILRTDFDWTVFWRPKNRFSMRMLWYKSALNRHRSPIKVVWWIGNSGSKNCYVCFWGTCYAQFTWHCACTVKFVAFVMGKHGLIFVAAPRKWQSE